MTQAIITLEKGSPEWVLLRDALGDDRAYSVRIAIDFGGAAEVDPDAHECDVCADQETTGEVAGSWSFKLNEYTWTPPFYCPVQIVGA